METLIVIGVLTTFIVPGIVWAKITMDEEFRTRNLFIKQGPMAAWYKD